MAATAYSNITILRGVQLLLTIIVLGLVAYVVDSFNGYGNWVYYSLVPGEASFLLFTSVWTILALAYLIVVPDRFPRAAHKFAILGVEVLTNIFWFAGWIAFAALLGRGCPQSSPVCRAGTAAAIFAAFEWILFCVTTFFAVTHVHRTRNTNETTADPAMKVDTSV